MPRLASFFGSFELGPVAGLPKLLAYTSVPALIAEKDP
jgi:small ligand-binding sensory domain FIST